MSHSRRHGWTRGPTRILPEEVRKYAVVYRARKILPEGDGFGEWQRGRISILVEVSQEDPEGMRALERRIRFARERSQIELEVFEIIDEGDEVPEGGTSEGIAKVVSERDYEGLKRKSSLLYPGHPLWEEKKFIH